MVHEEIIRKGSKVFLADTLNEPVTVLENRDGEISLKLKKVVRTTSEDLYPVPLTPENIIRCGFFQTDTFVFEHPVEKIELEIDYQGVTHMFVHTHEISIPLHSVHELQHAFWKYTAKEINY